MNKYALTVTMLAMSIINSYSYPEDKKQQDLILLDQVKIIVHGPEQSTIFCESDEGRHGIDGRPKDIQSCIIEELMFQDAKKLKIPLERDVIQDHLNKTLRMFGLKSGDEMKIFDQEGYTFEEGFEQFTKMYAVNAMTEFRIKSNLIVTEEQVLKYYQENPLTIEARYCIQTVLVLPQQKNEEGLKEDSIELEKRINTIIESGKSDTILAWSDLFWLKKSEMAQDLEKICVIKNGEIIKIPVDKGYQLYKLVASEPERLIPLHERYRDIVDTLKQPLYEKKTKQYKQELLKGATIIYL